MVTPDLTVSRRCGRKAKGHGGQCRRWAMHGQTVCHMHGGKSPQALRKADERMRELVHPAIAALERLIAANEFQAARYVLDWAGFRPSDNADDSDTGPVHVTVIFDRADQDQSPPLALNGHTPA